jgi:stage II sporulation protein R
MKSHYTYLFLALLLMWLNGAALAASGGQASPPAEQKIPDNAIRLRIIANSDTIQDQWVKHQVRDRIVDAVSAWVGELNETEQAKAVIRQHLPEIRQIVAETVKAGGFDYGYQVDLEKVPFPTKMYGDLVYPAGQYEALRIALGEAQGKNWWCVLFPPLCFVDLSNGLAVTEKTQASVKTGKSDGGAVKAEKPANPKQQTTNGSSESPQSPHIEKKLFVVQLFKDLTHFLTSLFQ